MSGWIPTQRSLFSDKRYEATKKKPWCDGFAWQWMVSEAAYTKHTIKVMGQQVTLDVGQFSHSVRYMATKFCWSENRVQRMLHRLVGEGDIVTSTDTGQLVVTICEYAENYLKDNPANTVPDTGSDTGSEVSPATKNNKGTRKQGNKGKGDDDLFGEKPKKIASHFPEDWKPSGRTVDGLTEKGFSPEQIADEAGRCADFHRSKGNTFKDHNGAFRNWMRNDLVQERKRQHERSASVPGGESPIALASRLRRERLAKEQAERDAADLRRHRQ